MAGQPLICLLGDFMNTDQARDYLQTTMKLEYGGYIRTGLAGDFAVVIAEKMADLTDRERRCPTMDEAEKVALLRAIQEITRLVGLDNDNSPKDAVDAVRKLTT